MSGARNRFERIEDALFRLADLLGDEAWDEAVSAYYVGESERPVLRVLDGGGAAGPPARPVLRLVATQAGPG